jgi:hypothetical protein
MVHWRHQAPLHPTSRSLPSTQGLPIAIPIAIVIPIVIAIIGVKKQWSRRAAELWSCGALEL